MQSYEVQLNGIWPAICAVVAVDFVLLFFFFP